MVTGQNRTSLPPSGNRGTHTERITDFGSAMEEEKALPKSLFGDISDISEKRKAANDPSAVTSGFLGAADPSVTMHVPKQPTGMPITPQNAALEPVLQLLRVSHQETQNKIL